MRKLIVHIATTFLNRRNICAPCALTTTLATCGDCGVECLQAVCCDSNEMLEVHYLRKHGKAKVERVESTTPLQQFSGNATINGGKDSREACSSFIFRWTWIVSTRPWSGMRTRTRNQVCNAAFPRVQNLMVPALA